MGSVKSITRGSSSISSKMINTSFLVILFVVAVTADFPVQNKVREDLPGVPAATVSGTCPNVKLQQDLDLEKYAGKWYWVSIIENEFLGKLSKCLRSEYKYSSAMVGFKVTTSGQSADGHPLSHTGDIRTTKEFPHASMSIVFEDSFPANYKVIETDYTSYSCVYSCTQTNAFKTEYGFIYSRNLSNNHVAAYNCAKAFKKNGIEFENFKPVDQSCWMPIPDSCNLSNNHIAAYNFVKAFKKNGIEFAKPVDQSCWMPLPDSCNLSNNHNAAYNCVKAFKKNDIKFTNFKSVDPSFES